MSRLFTEQKPVTHTNSFSGFALQLAVALWLIAVVGAFAQPGMAVWTNRFDGPTHGLDEAKALAVDSGGNVVVTGTSYVGSTDSNGDFVTVKYSGAGVPLWTNRFNSPGDWYDYAVAVVVDGAENVVVTGSSVLVGDAKAWGYVTIKYSAAGVPLWTNRYDGPAAFGYDYVSALAVDSSGNSVVTGLSLGEINEDYATIKYSGAGAPLWTNRYNGPGDGHDNAKAVVVDNSGNVIVTGTSYGGDDSYIDFLTIKYSPAGVPLWTNRYDGPQHDIDEASALAVDAKGNVFVTGWSLNGTYFDYTTLAYSSAGALMWIRHFGTPEDEADEAHAIAVDRHGNVLVSGWSGSSDPYFHGYVTIKYSGTGEPQWTNYFAGPIYEPHLPNMAVDSADNVYVSGDFGTVAYSSAGAPLGVLPYIAPRTSAVGVDSGRNVFVTGTWGVLGADYVTIKYSPLISQPIPLNYQIVGSQLVLSWTNTAFSLQTAPVINGAFTNVPGAISPFTNSVSGSQRYFRLKAN